jgi:hypothetical protein
MATKAQWQRKLLREIWVNKISSTGDRTTEADDMRVNNHAWKLSDSVASSRWIKMRSDIVA